MLRTALRYYIEKMPSELIKIAMAKYQELLLLIKITIF